MGKLLVGAAAVAAVSKLLPLPLPMVYVNLCAPRTHN